MGSQEASRGSVTPARQHGRQAGGQAEGTVGMVP